MATTTKTYIQILQAKPYPFGHSWCNCWDPCSDLCTWACNQFHMPARPLACLPALQSLENEHFKVERGGLTATTRSNPQLLVTGPQKRVVFGPPPPTKGLFQNALSAAAAAAATPVMPAAALSTIRMITKTQTQYGDSFRRYPNGR